MLLPLVEAGLMIVILEEQRRSAACMRACVGALAWCCSSICNADECYAKKVQKSAKKLLTILL